MELISRLSRNSIDRPTVVVFTVNSNDMINHRDQKKGKTDAEDNRSGNN